MKLVSCVADAVHHMKHLFDAVEQHLYELFTTVRVKCVNLVNFLYLCLQAFTLYDFINSGCFFYVLEN